jgi:hypothetical protein
MALNTTNAVTLNIITTEDTTGAVEVNRSVSLSYDSNFAQFISYLKVLTTNADLGTPVTGPFFQVYVKNNDPSNQVQILLQPTGDANVIVANLNPQDFICMWQKTSGNSPAGYTAVTAVCISGSSCLIEYFLGG